MLITSSKTNPTKNFQFSQKGIAKKQNWKSWQTFIQQTKNLQNQIYKNTPTYPNTHTKQWKAQNFTFKIQFCSVSKKQNLKTERETERAVNNLKCSEVLREKNNVRNHKWSSVLSAGKWLCRGGVWFSRKQNKTKREIIKKEKTLIRAIVP